MAYTLDNVVEVVRGELCTGCGTCAGVCPTEAISVHITNGLFLPEVKQDKCTRCRICLNCCPGYSVDFEKLNSGIFGNQPRDRLLGNYLRCYIGHANNNDVRNQVSSGGIATQLLVFALERRLIDGALVVSMKKGRPLEPQPFIARTREEILSASKSKYCPVPMNEALKQILQEDGRFAVVGLPCHIHGIRKAERVDRRLEKKIVLHIGLMCAHTVNFSGSEFLLEKMHISQEQVVKLDYRGRGWPGAIFVQLANGSNSTIPYIGGWNAYWPIFSCFFFTPMRCIMCPDQTSELADISLGDAWLPELKNVKSGESVIMTRTQVAEDILSLASSDGAVSIRPVKPEKVKHSQALPLKFKKIDLGPRLTILKSLGKETPNFNLKPRSKPSIGAFLRTFFPYFNIQASSNRHVKSFLRNVPFPIFRLYYGLYKFLSVI